LPKERSSDHKKQKGRKTRIKEKKDTETLSKKRLRRKTFAGRPRERICTTKGKKRGSFIAKKKSPLKLRKGKLSRPTSLLGEYDSGG